MGEKETAKQRAISVPFTALYMNNTNNNHNGYLTEKENWLFLLFSGTNAGPEKFIWIYRREKLNTIGKVSINTIINRNSSKFTIHVGLAIHGNRSNVYFFRFYWNSDQKSKAIYINITTRSVLKPYGRHVHATRRDFKYSRFFFGFNSIEYWMHLRFIFIVRWIVGIYLHKEAFCIADGW